MPIPTNTQISRSTASRAARKHIRQLFRTQLELDTATDAADITRLEARVATLTPKVEAALILQSQERDIRAKRRVSVVKRPSVTPAAVKTPSAPVSAAPAMKRPATIIRASVNGVTVTTKKVA